MRAFILAAVALPFVISQPLMAQTAGAPSPQTQRFVSTALTMGNFVDDAGRTALANDSSKPVQRFARAAVFEQAAVMHRIAPWSAGLTSSAQATVAFSVPGQAAAVPNLFGAPALTGSGSGVSPFATIGQIGSVLTGQELQTGRSGVAVRSDPRAALEDLQNRSGADFDRSFLAAQQAAYRQLLDAYSSYAASGDDPGLRKIAAKEVPILQGQLRRLGAN